MRGRRPLLVASVVLAAAASCASAPVVPEPTVRLAEDPPPLPQPPLEGPSDSDSVRYVRVAVHAGGRALLRWEGHLRTGVWTTLDKWTVEEFVTREAWGRLGERAPRRLLQVGDEVLSGTAVRVRPELNGAGDGDAFYVSFAAEVAQGFVGPLRRAGTFHGRDVELPAVRRRGYRFFGRAPGDFVGPVARWNDVTVYLGDDTRDAPPASGVVHFRSGEAASGFVVGAETPTEPVRAEAFVRVWTPAKPIVIKADGVGRADFRLVDRRRAAGFSFRGGVARAYGDVFSCEAR